MITADMPCLCSGKFTWRMSNFGLFRDMIRVQKIMSPPFSAGDCSLRISVYQSTVGGKEHLSLCLESKVSIPEYPEPICMRPVRYPFSEKMQPAHQRLPVHCRREGASEPLPGEQGDSLATDLMAHLHAFCEIPFQRENAACALVYISPHSVGRST